MGNALTARENRLIHGEGPLQTQNCLKKIKNKNKIINKKITDLKIQSTHPRHDRLDSSSRNLKEKRG